jgi:hypothetical protein
MFNPLEERASSPSFWSMIGYLHPFFGGCKKKDQARPSLVDGFGRFLYLL